MAVATVDEDTFVSLFEEHGPKETARRLGVDVRSVYSRRERLERSLGRQITGPENPMRTRNHIKHRGRMDVDLTDGVVLIGSDAHYWPDVITPAHRAFVKACETLDPALVIMNGDVFDGATVSRHPPIGWESRPTVVQEIGACQARLREIYNASPNARHIWTLGNHDARFETRLATAAPEFARVEGVHLKDHFPDWETAWSVFVNDALVVKHRFKGGIHATHNNTMWAGRSMVTGHLHSLKVTPLTDYNGTRFGVDCGTMAGVGGVQFQDYLEDNPVNWRSGFAVLTFRAGRLLWPEVVHVLDDDHVEFRGKIHEV